MHGPIPIRIVADFQIVRLTDAFTTVPHGEHLAATVTRARCHKQTGGEGVRGGSAVGQPTSLPIVGRLMCTPAASAQPRTPI